MFKSLTALATALVLAACATDTTPREPSSAPSSASAVDGDTVPRELPPAKPEASSWNAAALADVVSYVQGQKTTGFLIVQDGRTIAEQNWPLAADAEAFRANFTHGVSPDGALREDVASQQKAFIALLVGIAIDKGQLDIAKPVSAYTGAGWSKATTLQENAITVRNLLEMNSGLKEDLTFEAPAGEKFFYNTPAYAILKPVLEKASGLSLADMSASWLTRPLGMNDTKWEQRPAVFADVGNPTGLVTTPRDLAIMGQLVIDGGKSATGARIISQQQLDAIFQRTGTNPAYGRLWWLNGSSETANVGADAPRRAGQLVRSAPRDMVAALGAQDRKLFVVPGDKLIVVRTGQATPDRDFNEQLWLLLTKAMPQH